MIRKCRKAERLPRRLTLGPKRPPGSSAHSGSRSGTSFPLQSVSLTAPPPAVGGRQPTLPSHVRGISGPKTQPYTLEAYHPRHASGGGRALVCFFQWKGHTSDKSLGARHAGRVLERCDTAHNLESAPVGDERQAVRQLSCRKQSSWS